MSNTCPKCPHGKGFHCPVCWPQKPRVVMWVEDLTNPSKPRVCMGASGYQSVEDMQEELIRRRPRIGGWSGTPDYVCLEAIDKISNGVDVWRWSWAKGTWECIQRVTLEDAK